MPIILGFTVTALITLFSATSPNPAIASERGPTKANLDEMSEAASAEIARQTLRLLTPKYASPSLSLDVIRVSPEKHVMTKASFSCQPAGSRPIRSLVRALFRSYQLDVSAFNWSKIPNLAQLEILLAEQKAEVCEGSFLDEEAGPTGEVLGYLHVFYLRGFWSRVLVPVGVSFEWGG